ncbi:hypothetical protein DdX_09820 [Ditylenchus destructor]|uniref:Uncharacterized protein n=1 Tax=Ditylenchus destructor TaxID=166010 RepID=A0AAD4N5L8_9BILA|nr:hypothetical protein DdX_09820 [Ditylenchus destructor]
MAQITTKRQISQFLRFVDTHLQSNNYLDPAGWRILRPGLPHPFNQQSTASLKEFLNTITVEGAELASTKMLTLLKLADAYYKEKFVQGAVQRDIQVATEVLTRINIRMAQLNTICSEHLKRNFASQSLDATQAVSRGIVLSMTSSAERMSIMADLLKNAVNFSRRFTQVDNAPTQNWFENYVEKQLNQYMPPDLFQD